jgi:hypothetical protein
MSQERLKVCGKKKLKKGIKDAAETTLEFAPKRNSRDWFNEECRTAIGARNEARRQYLQRPTRAKEQEYRDYRREADWICRRKKRVAINERLQQMEEDFVNNDLVWEYKEVSTFKRGLVPRTSFIRSDKGKIVSYSMEIKVDEGNISTDTSTQLRKRRGSQKEISAVGDTSMMGRKKLNHEQCMKLFGP